MTDGTAEPTNADLLAFMQQAFSHLTTEISGVKADVGSLAADVADVKAEIRAVEAGLISRIDSVQHVVRSVKADISAHTSRPHDHRDAA